MSEEFSTDDEVFDLGLMVQRLDHKTHALDIKKTRAVAFLTQSQTLNTCDLGMGSFNQWSSSFCVYGHEEEAISGPPEPSNRCQAGYECRASEHLFIPETRRNVVVLIIDVRVISVK